MSCWDDVYRVRPNRNSSTDEHQHYHHDTDCVQPQPIDVVVHQLGKIRAYSTHDIWCLLIKCTKLAILNKQQVVGFMEIMIIVCNRDHNFIHRS